MIGIKILNCSVFLKTSSNRRITYHFRNMRKNSLTLLTTMLLILAATVISFAQAKVTTNWVDDQTNTLSAQHTEDLNYLLTEISAEKNLNISIKMISSIESESLEVYSDELLAKTKSSGNETALIVVAIDDRKVWVSVDQGLEGKMTAADRTYIIEEIIISEFRSGRFSIGFEEAIDAIVTLASGREIEKNTTFQLKNYPLISILAILVLLSVISGFVKDVTIKLGIALFVAVGFWLIFGSITYSVLILILSFFPLLGRSVRGGGGAYGTGYADGTEGAGVQIDESSYSLGGGTFSGGGASGDWKSFSFDAHKKFVFSEQQKMDVEQAVKELELESSGEIVVYFARRSDSYYVGSWKLAAVLGMLGLFTIMALSFVWMLPGTFSIMNTALSIFLLILMGLFVTYFFPAVRLAFVPLNVMDHRVVTKARDIFLQEEIFNTIDRTGILIYVSELEKRVQIIGDKGISSVIEQDDWNKVLSLVTDGIKKGNPAIGLVDAIHECKKLLLANGFVVREGDTNELTDEMRIED